MPRRLHVTALDSVTWRQSVGEVSASVRVAALSFIRCTAPIQQ